MSAVGILLAYRLMLLLLRFELCFDLLALLLSSSLCLRVGLVKVRLSISIGLGCLLATTGFDSTMLIEPMTMWMAVVAMFVAIAVVDSMIPDCYSHICFFVVIRRFLKEFLFFHEFLAF